MIQELDYYMVCVDCFFFFVYGDVPEDRPDEDEEDQWDQASVGAFIDIESAARAKRGTTPSFVPGDDDYRDSFSTARCESCGSRLHGERYRIDLIGEPKDDAPQTPEP